MRFIIFSMLIALGFSSCDRSGCTDARALNFDDKAKNNDGSCVYADSTKAIGLTYQGGIICYHFKQGEVGYVPGETHGLVMVPNTLGNAVWGCAGTNLPAADGLQVGSGTLNTQQIVLACTEPNTAASLADQSTFNTYNDWYLPSYLELRGIYENRFILNLPQTAYWTSSESDANLAYWVNFSNGTHGTGPKSQSLSVLAVRNF